MKLMNFLIGTAPPIRVGLLLNGRCLDLKSAQLAGALDFEIPDLLEHVIRKDHGIEEQKDFARDLLYCPPKR